MAAEKENGLLSRWLEIVAVSGLAGFGLCGGAVAFIGSCVQVGKLLKWLAVWP